MMVRVSSLFVQPQKRWLVDSMVNMRAVLRLLRGGETPASGPQKVLSDHASRLAPTACTRVIQCNCTICE